MKGGILQFLSKLRVFTKFTFGLPPELCNLWQSWHHENFLDSKPVWKVIYDLCFQPYSCFLKEYLEFVMFSPPEIWSKQHVILTDFDKILSQVLCRLKILDIKFRPLIYNLTFLLWHWYKSVAGLPLTYWHHSEQLKYARYYFVMLANSVSQVLNCGMGTGRLIWFYTYLEVERGIFCLNLE